MYALPTITEKRFKEYIQSQYEGYAVQTAFTVDEYQSPMVLIKAGQFKETEPSTGLYEGKLSVSVLTQIDDVENPLEQHDEVVAAIYDALANQEALMDSVNATGGRFKLWGMYINSYDQERAERSLMSVIESTIHCQTLEV